MRLHVASFFIFAPFFFRGARLVPTLPTSPTAGFPRSPLSFPKRTHKRPLRASALSAVCLPSRPPQGTLLPADRQRSRFPRLRPRSAE